MGNQTENLSLQQRQDCNRDDLELQNRRLLTWLESNPDLALIFKNNTLEALLTHANIFIRLVAKFLYEKVYEHGQ